MHTKELTRIALFAALTAVLSQIIIPLPLSPVPLSLATLGVMLCGGLLPPRQAFWSMAAFLLLGGVGLPVFAGFMGGPGRLFGPTGGYLLAYPFGALAAALLLRRFGRSPKVTAAALAACSAVCCVLGSLWLSFSADGIKQAFLLGTVPFLPSEAIKILLACVLLNRLRHPLNKQ